MKQRVIFTFAMLLAATPAATATEPACAKDARPGLLKALDGRWVMQGDVQGEPVTYALEVGPRLQCAFTELHMRDVAVPSQYEARVYVAADAADASVIVHWLDSFGGRASIPHGVGRIDGRTIEFTVPYPGEPFRDVLTLDAAAGTWTFVIEAGQPDGTWRHFARYTLRRELPARGTSAAPGAGAVP